ncbi:hypothetical protein B484DRAFT_434881 [Ochromonadaceae sp. CCMP2298]|nr:hypothetical protein B484DRAFT_434881 [Ochromonadaceae sp. CCMP2298]
MEPTAVPTLTPTPSPSNSTQPARNYTLEIAAVVVVVIGVLCVLALKLCQLWQAHVDDRRRKGRRGEPLPRDDETVDENLDENETVDNMEDELQHVFLDDGSYSPGYAEPTCAVVVVVAEAAGSAAEGVCPVPLPGNVSYERDGSGNVPWHESS